MKDRMRELTPHEIAILAEVEHNRWNVEELLMGYRTVTPEEEKEIEKNIELKNVYKEKRTAHYDIRPYEDLRSDEKRSLCQCLRHQHHFGNSFNSQPYTYANRSSGGLIIYFRFCL